MAERRVLSIQSHVVSGYVGNKSATFPLQILGFEVDTINSVQFSNHTGYKNGWKGQILNSEELGDLYEGLKLNDLHHYSHLLTGYIGSESFLLQVKDVINDLRQVNPDLIYVCDPVMGDMGKMGPFMYVPKELLPIYRDCIIPLADIVTPNQYEAELLTGISITDEDSAKQAMAKLLDMGAKTAVISSSDLGSQDILVAMGTAVNNGSRCSIKVEMPKLPANFTGTGDLFASLLLAWLSKHPHDLQLACEKTVSTMQSVLKKTLARAQELAGPGNKPTKHQLELKLVQSKQDIETPEICVKACPL